jgi:HEAT repeat protein
MANARPASRFRRTIYALIFISAVGVVLSVYNLYTNQRDLNLATGPESPAQKAFFVTAADRPDIAAFFKSLKPEQRLTMAQNIGRYSDPKLPQLAAILLGDFSVPAREALAESLKKLVKDHPEKVAEELKRGGSFQQTGITSALREYGDGILPFVAKQVTVGDARNHAVNFLVDAGSKSTSLLVPMLTNESRDVRMAAAEGLGKIADRASVPALLSAYQTGAKDDKLGFFSALASVGDPGQEPLMQRVILDPNEPMSFRAQAAIGLGRIRTPSAARVLWTFVEHPDLDFRRTVVASLQSCGNVALQTPGSVPIQRIAVAAGIEGSVSDAVIRSGLRNPETLEAAAIAAAGRAGLRADVEATLRSLDVRTAGDRADLLVSALAAMPNGSRALQQADWSPEVAALVRRRLSE